MKTLLIPVDFSEASENVINYVAGFSSDNRIERIILLKSFYISVYAQLLPSADFVQLSAEDIDEERQEVEAKLQVMSHKLLQKCNPSSQIKTAVSELPLVRAVHQLIADERPGMVMMGSDKNTYDNDSYTGEQIIAIAKTSTIPVMVIPADVRYKKIDRALIPCDFEAISGLSALKGLRNPQNWQHPHLMVLNIDPKQKQSANDEQMAAGLVELLDGYDYKVYHSEDKDTVHGILDFADEYGAQLIIALPGKYSFFYNLTHRSITRALALNATIPVLILK